MPLFSLLKGAKLLKTVKVARTASKVSKVSKLGKVGLVMKELPVVKIVAGSAIGIAAIDWWNRSRNSVSDVLGISEQDSTIVIVVVIAIVLALIVSLFRRR